MSEKANLSELFSGIFHLTRNIVLLVLKICLLFLFINLLFPNLLFSDSKEDKYKLPDIPPAPAEATLLSEARSVTYEDIARRPDEMKGTLITFTGEVYRVIEKENRINLSIDLENDLNKTIYITFDPSIISYRILEDDKLKIWGLHSGLHTYRTITGSDNTLPICIAYKIELLKE